MILPSNEFGKTTATVAYFDCGPESLARWLENELGSPWHLSSQSFESTTELFSFLSPTAPWNRSAIAGIGSWSAYLSNGPLGTDVGVIPSLATRRLEVRSVVAIDSKGLYPSVQLEVFDPGVTDHPSKCRRSVCSANDGGRWVFGDYGQPFSFEDQSSYGLRRKKDRFTSAMLGRYLHALNVPVDDQLEIDTVWILSNDQELR
jgi:hypothetical protein